MSHLLMFQIQELVDASHKRESGEGTPIDGHSSHSGSTKKLSAHVSPGQSDGEDDKHEKLEVGDSDDVHFTFTPVDPAREQLLSALQVKKSACWRDIADN